MGELANSFGAQLKAARLARKLTQAELADAASMSEEWIRRIERGEASPRFDGIEALCAALNIRPAELFQIPGENGFGQQLTEKAKGLSEAEMRWLLELVDHVRQRPAD